MTLLQQCRIWYKNKEFQRIVNAMEALPFENWTPALAGMLEKARNGLKEEMEKDVLEGTGLFTGQILLSEPRWDKQKLIRRLGSEWGLKARERPNQQSDSLLFFVRNTILSVCLISSPVPDGQAEHAAASNYLWPEAEERIRTHTARIFVGAMGDDASLLDRGRLLVEVLASCCDQENALGVFVNGTVYETRLYETLAKLILLNRLPVDNWIWFSFFHDAGGVSCYTRGMRAFGKEELEAIHCGEKSSEARELVFRIAAHVLQNNIVFHGGEVIHDADGRRYAVSRGEGIFSQQETIRIFRIPDEQTSPDE
ncbi:DUF4261 domain-containing protein [Anaeromassilibacillus sp. An200]|uniref:DUF4261 domain-containing protein n=1 Tax=Anaeromassilibacillus sp. An200 TaxID=1965587 RepID=UPI000B39A103|nr:DUF4261 domain-containing protein [Anaeromassilibacillus sp. An200]OUP12681.1 hypothetical protein B5F35_07215 [Anaeromassilibacillus sp. An200]